MSIKQPPTFKIGDKVAYSVQFLRSIGETTGEMPFARGTVTAIQPLGSLQLVTIDWEGNYTPPDKVIAHNLAHVGPNRRFANCD
jgi:hypothetical protein